MTTFSSITRPEIEKMPLMAMDSPVHLAAKAKQPKALPSANGSASGAKSFAASMEKAKSAKQPALLKEAPTLKTPVAPMGHTQQRFEEVLGDSMGLADVRALATMSQIMSTGGSKESTIDSALNMGGSGKLMGALTGRIHSASGGYGAGAIKSGPSKISAHATGQTAGNAKNLTSTADTSATEGSSPIGGGCAQAVTGALSSKFESGKDGVAAIGYDSHGGTSYGKYQLASAVGTMGQFIKFLRKEAPDLAKRLASAGEADTGSRSGTMPTTWKKIASESPGRFESLQEKFIHESHYKPALDALTDKTGLAPEKMSVAVQEVLWSTAVQHGPNAAARMFARAVDKVKAQHKEPGTEEFDKSLIEKVYAMRSGQFGSSSERVQNAVQNRLNEEKSLALAMVKESTPATTTAMALATDSSLGTTAA